MLPVFRLFTVLQLGFLLVSVASFTWYEEPQHPISAMWLMLIVTALLIPYLSWSGLERRLGAAYLPIALVIISAVPFIGEFTALMYGPTEYLKLAKEISLLLVFSLLVISWQYSFRTVTLFCLTTSLVDFGLSYLVFTHRDLAALEYEQALFGRTIAFLAAGYIIARLMREQRKQRRSL
ncbi:MAG: hypothetical protein C0393_07095, partial [Anaerolinea sp.]|nr:hypothetical protein [Anaerolinea sp.]